MNPKLWDSSGHCRVFLCLSESSQAALLWAVVHLPLQLQVLLCR